MEATTADLISAGANVVTAFGALGAVGVASAGLALWRYQLIGSDEYRVAKELLTIVYQMHLTASKYYAALKSDGKWHKIGDLTNEMSELWPKFEAIYCEAGAIFGRDFQERHFQAYFYYFQAVIFDNCRAQFTDSSYREDIDKS